MKTQLLNNSIYKEAVLIISMDYISQDLESAIFGDDELENEELHKLMCPELSTDGYIFHLKTEKYYHNNIKSRLIEMGYTHLSNLIELAMENDFHRLEFNVNGSKLPEELNYPIFLKKR